MAGDKHDKGGKKTAKKKSTSTSASTSRRKFVAGASAAGAAAVLAKTKVARAAGPPGAVYRIHPAIGVARVGNADPSTFFIGPESPGFGPNATDVGVLGSNHKVGGAVRPQAARFRIYEYAPDANGRLAPVREINLDPINSADVASITWTVHLANKKASFHGFEGGQGENRAPAALRNASVTANRQALLEIDLGPRSVSGKSAAPVEFNVSNAPAGSTYPTKGGAPIIDYLGQLRTDANGRLIAIGGKGKTGYNTATQPPMPHWANNDGWFDDASDGPVTAVVTFTDGTRVEIGPNGGGAWLLVGPPDFAPGIPGSVTAYDLMLDMAVRSETLPIEGNALYWGGPLDRIRRLRDDYTAGTTNVFPTYVPSYQEEIYPMLLAAYHLWWIDALVTSKHNSLIDPKLGDPSPANNSARARVFNYMRAPLGIPQPGGAAGTMPKILGDDPYIGQMPDAVKKLAITPTQYGLLSRWASNAFVPGEPPPSVATITPAGLDRAALENCVGGAFYPGIEFGWQMRNPGLFAEPFRLNHDANSQFWGETNVKIGPGHFSRQMAVPWQADFNDCRNEGNYAWWPAQRPTDALPAANAKQRLPWARPNNRFEGGNRESTHEDMVKHWYKFGFVLEDGDIFVEKERAASIP